MFLRTRNW